ncbi:TIGR01459 family HAD-type hydrolase [Ancylobacter lacus]|uniref:TIGR01459 family HAD-type hydrolase n=1 Tax=Ancylobacter lacus TaxID=2579970 RepID=UPI001BCC3993|nr:TIGR01459 family HAD-type hydrolase [Ancylobacter lacus]MBS7539708.1 TIGR01459 family HAD-type hydrolase [Ancylobacter lacus]
MSQTATLPESLRTAGASVPIEPAFQRLAPRYDVVLCDIWGVLHNGHVGAPAAADALQRFRAAGGTVVLVSNAPRPWREVVGILDSYDVPHDAYDAIVSSGEVTMALLRAQPRARLHHLGPARDVGLFAGLPNPFVGLEEAELIVCTGLIEDDHETPAAYEERLDRARALGLPMICANPDIVVERGGDLIWCAGALAEAYAERGGEVIWCGKPHASIYERALATAAERRGGPAAPGRVLAIGDALRTDLAGALQAGVDCLFVAAGIHAGELGLEQGGEIDPHALARLLADGPGQPTAVTTRLAW